MAMGIFEQLDWLTKKVKALCCIVEKGGGSALRIQDDGTTLTTEATSINFTGDGVTATNVGSEVTVHIPGTVTVNNTMLGDGTSGNPLSTAMPVYNTISLASADYPAYSEGIYQVVTGTDINAGAFSFIFPDPSLIVNQGKRVVITNNDPNLPVYTNGFTLRGTSLTSYVVPSLATYEFVSSSYDGLSWFWLCITPDVVVYNGIGDLAYQDYEIKTHGTYQFNNGSDTNSVILPPPTFFSGHTITIINSDYFYSIKFSKVNGTDPMYQGSTESFQVVDSWMIVDFISDGTAWMSKTTTFEPTYKNIQLTLADYTIPLPGFYEVTNSTGFGIIFPDTNGVGYNGQTITIWNRTDSGDCPITGTEPQASDEGSVGSIPVWTIDTYKCIGNTWVLVNRQQGQ